VQAVAAHRAHAPFVGARDHHHPAPRRRILRRRIAEVPGHGLPGNLNRLHCRLQHLHTYSEY
ncbi:MAG: hypothetical protein AAB297_05730, partial [Acidobacteriota bacterium]